MEVRNEFEMELATSLHTHPPPPPPSVHPSTPHPALSLQEFQDEIAPIQDDVTHMNQLASTFGPHDVQLSPANLERLDDLNTRWKLLQVRCPPPPVCCQGGGEKNKQTRAHHQMYRGRISIQRLRLHNAALQMFAAASDCSVILSPLEPSLPDSTLRKTNFSIFNWAPFGLHYN